MAILPPGLAGDGDASESLEQLARREAPPEFLKGSALILLEDERIEISGRSAVHELRLVKRVLKSGHPEEGAFRFGTSRGRKILSIEGRAVYPDGREKVLSSDDISIVPDFEDFVLYSDRRSHAFRFPGVAAGTVIEVAVRWRIENLVYWEPAVFRRDVPILARRYSVIHPRDLAFAVHASNMDRTCSREADLGGKRMLLWERHDIPPLEREDLMPPELEIVPALWFSIGGEAELGGKLRLDSWSGVVDWYRELSRESLVPTSEWRRISDSLRAASVSDREAASRMFRWTQANLRYAAIYLGLDGYRPHGIGDILANRYGDCKDKAVVLAAALGVAGIEASLVLVRTADLGAIPGMLPTPHYFNHAIVAARLDSDMVFLDPTCESCSFGVLPRMDQGAEALVIGEGENGLTVLPSGSPRPNRYDVTLEAAVAESGDARAAITVAMDGYFAAEARHALSHRGGKSLLEFVIALLRRIMPAVRVEGVSAAGEDPSADTLTLAVTGTIPGMIDTGAPYSFMPVVLDPLSIELSDCDERICPVSFGAPATLGFEASITLPEGWGIPEAPSSGALRTDWFDYSYRWSVDGRSVRFSRRWSSTGRRAGAAECAGVRSGLDAVLGVEESRVMTRRR